jgi:hypothetical protein
VWIAPWAVEISQYDVEFVPRWTTKFQALTYFIAEWTDLGLHGVDELPDHWVMYFDETYTLNGAGVGVVLILCPPEGGILKDAILPATNNVAKYEGLVTRLQLA